MTPPRDPEGERLTTPADRATIRPSVVWRLCQQTDTEPACMAKCIVCGEAKSVRTHLTGKYTRKNGITRYFHANPVCSLFCEQLTKIPAELRMEEGL